MTVPLAVGVIAAVTITTATVLGAAGALTTAARVAAAADNAALAVADSAYLYGAGQHCELAAALAAAHRVQLVDCVVNGWEARVTVRAQFGHFMLQQQSRAG